VTGRAPAPAPAPTNGTAVANGTGGTGLVGGSTALPGMSIAGPDGPDGRDEPDARVSGRRKHDTKITVYVSGDELLALERTRLALRASHQLPVDRGRIVREAVALLLADFETNGEESVLVRRLRGE
jgi:hypothetical protein